MSRIGVALCLVLGLGGCDNQREAQAQSNAKLCADFTPAKPAAGPAPAVAPAAEGPAMVEECVRRWAYSLAPSRDEASVVADAVVAACGAQLSRWNQQLVNQPAANAEAASIITGQPTTPLAERYSYLGNRALLYVVQARAGRCAPPRAANGAPEGVG
jgi:hypothetical protein